MGNTMPQSYANHRRFVPLFHFVLAGMLLLNLVWAIRHIIIFPTPQHAVELMIAIAFLLLFFFPRQFATTVQDRVVRLEETLRYQRLLPADLQARAGELTLRQVIGLRFASDAELPGLVRKALDEKLSEGAIKQQVKDWRPDNARA